MANQTPQPQVAPLLPKNPNLIDRQFFALTEFLRRRDTADVKNAILINLRHFQFADPVNYRITVDYYNQYHYLWGKIDPENGVDDLAEDRALHLTQHLEDFEWLYGRLGDYRSKKVLLVLLSYWLTWSYAPIGEIQEKIFSQYFDLDLISCDENEVFVDIGAYIGDTLVDYAKIFGENGCKKIYCYEIAGENVKFIEKNMEQFGLKNVDIRRKAAGDHNGVVYIDSDTASSVCKPAEEGRIPVDSVMVDDDITEPVTFIKMDIEGGEEQALLGCRKKIAENHPKLALSVYHNHKDLWKLARVIDGTDPSYHFYLRYYGLPLVPTEYLLYAL